MFTLYYFPLSCYDLSLGYQSIWKQVHTCLFNNMGNKSYLVHPTLRICFLYTLMDFFYLFQNG